VAIDATVATLTGSQTLTNKTLTSPALTTPTISTLTTNGDLLYGTGSGALARLGIGTTGQVVTVASGIPSWATPAASASGLTFLARTSVSAVANTGSTFDSLFSSTYLDYLIILESFRCGTGTPTMGIQLMKSGVASTSGYYGSMIYGTYTATQYLASNAAAQFNIFGLNAGSDNSATITVANASAASGSVQFTANAQDAATDRYGAGGAIRSCDTYTGFRLLPASSTITGTVSVYGYQKV
jgi:hypothetical protein